MVKETSGFKLFRSLAVGLMSVGLMAVASLAGENKDGVGSKNSFDFKDVDSDGSGCVEGAKELQTFRSEVRRILGESLGLGDLEKALRAAKITLSADVSGDGRICECDLLSILLSETSGLGRHHHAFRVYEDGSIFDDVDADKDGYLGEDESEALAVKLSKCVPLDKARAAVHAMAKLAAEDGKVSREEYLQFLAPVPSSLPAVPGPARLDQPALPQSLQAAQVQPASQPETTVKVISVPKVQQGQARVDHSLASQSQQQQDEGVVRQDPFQPPSATATSDQSALHLEHDLQEPAELVQSFNAWRLHHQQQESPDVAEVQQEILRETTNSTKTVGADSPQRSVGN